MSKLPPIHVTRIEMVERTFTGPFGYETHRPQWRAACTGCAYRGKWSKYKEQAEQDAGQHAERSNG